MNPLPTAPDPGQAAPPSDALLEFSGVSLPADPQTGGGLSDFTWQVRPGEFHYLQTPPAMPQSRLADLAGGLLVPETGVVRYAGRTWTERSPDELNAARATIGRIFGQQAWLSNLDLDENIMLAARHHAARPVPELEAEALALARALGLPDLPRVRPAWADATVLRHAQWVRALLGQPRLLLVESWVEERSEHDILALREPLFQLLRRGGAILWAGVLDAARLRAWLGLDPAGVFWREIPPFVN